MNAQKTAENTELIHRIPPRKKKGNFLNLKMKENALEKSLIALCTFFLKKAEKIEENRYHIMVDYDKDERDRDGNPYLILWTDDQSCAARAFYKI